MFEDLINFIQTFQNPRVHLFLHHSADPDALCAAVSLGELLQRSLDASYLIYTDNSNQLTKRIIDEMNIAIEDELPELDKSNDLIILVDMSNLHQLGSYETWVSMADVPKILIDHHHTSMEKFDDESKSSIDFVHTLIQPNAGSTCMIVTKMYTEMDIVPSADVATLLLSGHIYDSRRFLYGTDAQTFQYISKLIQYGGNYELANTLLQSKMSVSEIIARIKASKRISYILLDSYLVLTSHIGAFEASVARSFIGMGASCTLVLGKKNDELRGSARRVHDFPVSMGEVVEQLAKEFGGKGGGHDAAAGFNIVPPLSNKKIGVLKERFYEIIKEKYLFAKNT